MTPEQLLSSQIQELDGLLRSVKSCLSCIQVEYLNMISQGFDQPEANCEFSEAVLQAQNLLTACSITLQDCLQRLREENLRPWKSTI